MGDRGHLKETVWNEYAGNVQNDTPTIHGPTFYAESYNVILLSRIRKHGGWAFYISNRWVDVGMPGDGKRGVQGGKIDENVNIG